MASDDNEDAGATPASGTANGLIAFLGWVIDNDYMATATASGLRTGAKKVLEVESDLDGLDIRHAELDDILHRFRTRNRGKMKDKSVEVYEQRFRQSVEMYRKWLNSEKDWLPATRRRSAAPGNGQVKAAAAQPVPTRTEMPTEPQAPGMITYPFPIRPGLQGKITLPEDLSRREAERIAAFINTLAFDEHQQTAVREPLAITSGESEGFRRG